MNLSDENDSFSKRVITVVGIVTFAVILIFLFVYVLDVILLLFGAVLLAIFLHGLANISRRYLKLSEGTSVLLASAVVATVLGLGIWLLAPSVAEQVRHLRQELPTSLQKASDYIAQFGWGRALIEQLPTPDDIVDTVNNSSFLSRIGGYFSTTVGMVTNFFLMILLAIYLASEPKLYIHGFTKLFPKNRRKRVREILYEIGETLSWWLVGKGASMLFIGLLTWVGLWVLGVPLSLTLGLIAGLFSFVPNFGPILSALPAILLAFIESPIKALYVLILFVVVQLIESNLVTPLIERRTVELPPVLTIMAQLALSLLIGAVGLILATPLLAVVMVLVQTIYIQDILGDKDVEVEGKTPDSSYETKVGKDDKLSPNTF